MGDQNKLPPNPPSAQPLWGFLQPFCKTSDPGNTPEVAEQNHLPSGGFLVQRSSKCDPDQQLLDLLFCPVPQTEPSISSERCLLLPVFERDNLNVCVKSKVNN